MKVIPFPLNWYFITLIQVPNGFLSLQKKKTPIFAPNVSSATAISFAYQRLLIVMRLISIYVLTLILSGKLGENLPK